MNKADEYRVFFVLSWGYAGDHWFSWFAKSLDAHPEVLALMAHEGSRSKYLAERSRSERPPLSTYSAFLEDMGKMYESIGDCWSYRPWHFFREPELASRFPLLFLLRHPYVWLEFYTRWRVNNLRTVTGSDAPLQHEWKISKHTVFKELDLMPYEFKDVEVWSAYQGMYQMNRHCVDIPPEVQITPLEQLVHNPESLQEAIEFLSRGNCRYTPGLLDQVYSWTNIPFRGEAEYRAVPNELFECWPEWKKTAWERLVLPETKAFYCKHGKYLL